MTISQEVSLPLSPAPATSEWMTRKQAAEHMALSVQTLARWAMLETGVPFSRFGGVVRYKKSDCDEFMESHKVAAR